MKDKILNWLANGSVGASSKAMAFAVQGVSSKERSHPWDPADLDRCLLFLEAVPEARKHMDKIAKLSPTWALMVDHWDEIEKTFLDEVGLDWCNGHTAPVTYHLMKEIIKEAQA